MKLYLSSLLCLLIVQGNAQPKPLVVSTASMIQDIAMHIGGEFFSYQMIVPIGGDPHIYEPTPSDAQLCSNANLILKNGLTFEGWISKLIDNSGTKAPVVTVTEGITPIASTLHANATDPHAWMEASNGIIYAKNISEAMTQLLPGGAENFRGNFEKYKAELEKLDHYIFQRIQSISENKRILITSHDSFHYYGKRYGLRLESILGTSTDADVQTADIRRLNEVIRSSEVPVVFVESTINPKMLEQIAHDNHIGIGGKLYSDSLSDKDGPAPTYIEMLRHNSDTIYEGLSRDRGEEMNEANASGSRIWLWFLLLAPIVLTVVFFALRMIRK
ncbi:MAG TPA: zinc ABC transporter substrate-binding protein [Saprospiraceae bacterium]|nr:zinc ABC transporter substrate-binding protein [Saprospiraceae bacterium]